MKLEARNTERWTRKHLVAAVAMATLGVLATLPAWIDIHTIAMKDEESSHIFLVPFVAIWMVWVRRARVRYCRPTGQLLGPIIAAFGWMMAAYGFYHEIQSFWHAGSVLVVMGCVISVLGRHALFRFLPAAAVLIFLVPVPGRIRLEISMPLQAYTASIAKNLLEIFGADVQQSGNLLSINGQPVTIIEACNGLRMVFALILVSFAFSFGLPLRNSVRMLVLVVSPIAAIACNLVRIIPTMWLFGYLPRGSNIGSAFHTFSGWMMLPIAFLLLLGIIRTLRWAMIPVMRYTLAAP